MKVVLASLSAVKADACREAFGGDIIAVKAASDIAEQPFNDETLKGAFNRIGHAREKIADADLYVSIENGIFEEDGKYIDRAVVVVMDKSGRSEITYGDGVEFPKDCVEEARRRGFDRWTAGKVMEEKRVVRSHDDPHRDLSGKSRASYIREAALDAARKLVL